MRFSFATRSLAALLVLCLVAVGAAASAQSIHHESQHAHHQKAAHGTVLCSWMCTAGHALDIGNGPHLVKDSPIALVDELVTESTALVPYFIITSRGPPVF